MSLTVAIDISRPEPGTAVVALDGNCDVYTAPQVREALIGLINEASYWQVIDLSRVTLLDSTGLGVLVGAAKRAVAHGGRLTLVVDLDSRVGKVLRITGVYKAIGNAPTVEEALKMLRQVPTQPAAPSPREIAERILQAMIRDEARLVPGDRIDENLDALVDSGGIRGHDYDALRALADAVDGELRAAAEQDRITVTIAATH